MLDWDQDRDEVLDRIRANISDAKVVLKTKNETHFLTDWIEHYSKIFGRDNIIIFDNYSDNLAVFECYRSNVDILVVGFKGFHNNIHNKHQFQDLYDALSSSCRFYTFLDTDEFLIAVSEDKLIPREQIINSLASTARNDFIPTAWLTNVPFRRDVFMTGTDFSALSHGLIWGKPILSAEANSSLKGFLNHNCDLTKAGAVPSLHSGVFLLHLANLYPKQRISTNREKLIARGFINKDQTIDEIMSLDISSASNNEILYVNEIKHFNKYLEISTETDNILSSGMCKIVDGEPIAFADTETEFTMKMFISNFQHYVHKLLCQTTS